MLRKKKTISDKIAESFLPRPLADPENASDDDETTAKLRTFDDSETDEDFNDIDFQLSDIRKKNVKLLQDVDEKYRGQISSRKDLENQERTDEEEEEEEEALDSSSEENANFSMRLRVSDSDSDEQDNVNESDSSFNKDPAEINETHNEDENDSDAESNFSGGSIVGTNDKFNKTADDNDSDVESSFNEGSIMGDQDEPDNSDDNDENAENDDESLDSGGSFGDEPSGQPTISPSNKNADIQKGICVQNQMQIWEKLLEVRIHSQKMLLKANSLPHFEKFEEFKGDNPELSGAIEKTTKNIGNLLSKMCEMQTVLIEQYPETKNILGKRKHSSRSPKNDAEFSDHLANTFVNYKDYRNSTILKWYDRTKVLTPGSKQTQQKSAHNVLQNIEGLLANKQDLIRKSQTYKGGYKIIGENNTNDAIVQAPNAADDDDDEDDKKVYTEIYDDTDFYHTQLRELIEFKANTAQNSTEMTKQFIELQKIRNKLKKVVDTRASKGRKIRYVVHNKMVNFMARNDASEWTDEAKTELFSSLFGARTQ